MQLFSKASQNTNKTFNKVGQGHALLKKMSHVAGSINKIGSFLSPMSYHHHTPDNHQNNHNSLERAIYSNNHQKNMYN